MAYDKQAILQQGMDAIKRHELTTIDEVEEYLSCGMSILYETPEWKLEVLEPLKRELDRMKVSLKARMKKDWRKAESNPTLQIAAFKLMATPDELALLTVSKTQNEHTGKDGAAIETNNQHTVIFKKMNGGDNPDL